MSSRLGIYDIFSRIVPGGFYLAALVEFARVLNLIQFDWSGLLMDLEAIPALGLAFVAFVVGSAMDSLSDAWHRIVKKVFRLDSKDLAAFKQEHTDWRIDFQDKDWAILRAYIYTKHHDVAGEIERHNALSIMMRNISLGLALLAVSEAIQVIKTADWRFGFLGVVLLFLSYQSAVQARNMHDWFYRSIYETIIAYGLQLEDILKPVRASSNKKKIGETKIIKR